MKRTKRILWAVLAVLLITALAMPVLAAEEPDWQQIEAEFEPTWYNDVELEIGETEKPTASVYLNGGGKVYCSNDSVVSVNSEGVVTGKAEGVAYVIYVTPIGNYESYRFTVVKKSVASDLPLPGFMEDAMGGFQKGITFHSIMSLLVTIFIVGVIGIMIATVILRGRYSKLFKKVMANPCEETAQELYKALYKRYVALNYNLARNAFNNYINPSEKIQTTTKFGLRTRLIELRTYGLDELRLPKEELDKILKEFGTKGEDNVWHNLQSLMDMGNYDIYRNVRVQGAINSNEIDAIVVSEKAGIFLLEIKTLGGKRQKDGSRLVSYGDMNEAPGNQIMRHHLAFEKLIAKCGVASEQIRDLLVLSYPHGEQRRLVDYASFPQASYSLVEVDNVLSFIVGQNGIPVTAEQRKAIANELMSLSSQSMVACMNRQELEAAYANMKAKLQGRETSPAPKTPVCPSCGKELTEQSALCPDCGNKLQ